MLQEMVNVFGGIVGMLIRVIFEDSGYILQNVLVNYQCVLVIEGLNLVVYFGDLIGFMKLVVFELIGFNVCFMILIFFVFELVDLVNNLYQFLLGLSYEDQFDILLQSIKDQGGLSVVFVYLNIEFGFDLIVYGCE